MGEGQREREIENPKQAPGSELSAQSPTGAQTHKLRDHDLNRSQLLKQLSHTGAPLVLVFNEIFAELSVLWLEFFQMNVLLSSEFRCIIHNFHLHSLGVFAAKFGWVKLRGQALLAGVEACLAP